jgi:antitoxin ParD1/3/4
MQQGIELLRQKMEDEALERAAQAELLRDRRSGPFLSATRMHSRLSRMIARNRQVHVVRD